MEETKGKTNNSDNTDTIRQKAGTGSKAGQAKRAEHSCMWWKFWGE
jgi:hypothetical protein